MQNGTSEIWRTFAPAPLSNVSVTAALSGNFNGSMTVMSFTGVDPSGSNGSGAIGVTAMSSATSAAPSAGLTTSRDGSRVFAVGNDTKSNASRTPDSGQNVVHQYLGVGNRAYWVQGQISPAPVSGTSVTIGDTAPAATYNLSAVEILPPAACVVSPLPSTRTFGIAGGSSNVIVADGMGCNWTVSTNVPAWITIGGGSGTGNGAFTATVSPSVGPSRLGTITAGSQPFKVLEQGTTSVFADVVSTTPNFDYINLMYYSGLSRGCSVSPLDYCPSAVMTRGQMAAYVVSALDGINYVGGGLPSSYTLTPYFGDVPATNPFFPFVQRLADLHLAFACADGNPPSFCPSHNESQAQMALVLILGWMHANNLSSFTYSYYPYFTDVPVANYYFPYVQKMRDMGFWTGCGPTTYCPGNSVLESDVAAQVMRSLLGAP